MKGRILDYFVCGNTARGSICLLDSNLKGFERVHILENGSYRAISEIIKETGENCIDRGIDIEYLHDALDKEKLEGVLIPGLGVGVVSGLNQKLSGVVLDHEERGRLEVINENVGNAVVYIEEIKDIEQDIEEFYEDAYEKLKEALLIHDDWEKIYIKNMDFREADRITESFAKSLFKEDKYSGSISIKHRFFGAATYIGAVDYIQQLTADIEKRIFIKGRPGTGKSTFLKKIASLAGSKGVDVEVYHCGFDPDSLDMLVFRTKSVAAIDTTSPHEYYPTRVGDVILDMYEAAVKPLTDETYKEQLEKITAAYKQKIREATAFFGRGKGTKG